jgi:hypothetical protein
MRRATDVPSSLLMQSREKNTSDLGVTTALAQQSSARICAWLAKSNSDLTRVYVSKRKPNT